MRIQYSIFIVCMLFAVMSFSSCAKNATGHSVESAATSQDLEENALFSEQCDPSGEIPDCETWPADEECFVTYKLASEVLQNDADIDDKQSMLEYACDAKTVQLLLKSGASVNARNDEGRTPLMYAAKNLRSDSLKALIAAGADVNARAEDGKTPLMYSKDVESVKVLSAAGADVNAKDNLGITPLMLAANNRDVELVKALIAAGADVNAKDNDGKTVREYLSNIGINLDDYIQINDKK